MPVISNSMKQQHYSLKINKPCGQNWSTMTQSNLGKFCSHCSKTVIDFTSLNNAELLQHINQAQPLCVRLTNQQLNSVLTTTKPASGARFHKLLTGLLLIGSTKNAYTSANPTVQTEISSSIESTVLAIDQFENIENSRTDSLKNVIQGKALDANTNEPIAFAAVFIKGTKLGVSTDFDGNFKLIIPDSLVTENFILVLSLVGYQKKELLINKSELPISKNILILEAENSLMGLVEVKISKKKKWWQFW